MYFNEFQDIKLSALGLGTMRLPTTEDGRIDREKLRDMVKLANAEVKRVRFNKAQFQTITQRVFDVQKQLEEKLGGERVNLLTTKKRRRPQGKDGKRRPQKRQHRE